MRGWYGHTLISQVILHGELAGMASRLEISSELAGIISGAEICGVSISGNVPHWGLLSVGRWVRSLAHPSAYGTLDTKETL